MPDEKLGKVFSMWSTIAFVGESVSAILAGAVIGLVGAIYGMVFAGLVLIAVGGFGYIFVRYVSKSQRTDLPTNVSNR